MLAAAGIAYDTSITETKIERQTKTIYYNTKTYYDNTKYSDYSETKQEGINGEKSVEYLVTYKNSQEIKRTSQSEDIITPSQDEILIVGTKPFYTCSNGTRFDTIDAKNECENRISWEQQRNSSLAQCQADPNKANCWYDEYPGTTLHWTEYYYRPTVNTYNGRTGAICRDGWQSSATGRGACSHHGGALYWI